MKSFAKLLAFVLTICLVGGSVNIASAQETTSKTTRNVKKLSSSINTDNSCTLTVGETKDVTVNSAKYYSVKGKDVISVTKSGKTLTIEAVNEGEASITFKNSKKKVIERLLITVEADELIEDTDDTDDTDSASSDAQAVQPTAVPSPTSQPGQTSDQNSLPTQAPAQHEEGANKPVYNGVVYLPVGEKSTVTQMYSLTSNETISLTMADGYIVAVNNGETVSAMIVNGTLSITLKKMADPYVIVADANGKSIYRIHVMPLQ